MTIIIGTDASDYFSQSGADFVIVGGYGNDTIITGPGNDWLLGNQDNDILVGGAGVDTLVGGKNHDLLFGNQDGDLLLGNEDNDSVYGGLGEDTIYGGFGYDLLFGNEGNDLIFGNEFSDVIDGGAGQDTVAFAGPMDRYIFLRDSSGRILAIDAFGDGGDDVLSNVEIFQFSDLTIAASQLPFVTAQNDIVAIGDSMTVSYGASSPASTWPALLQQWLGVDVDVIARNGATAQQMADQFAQRPDLWDRTVVIWLGHNGLDDQAGTLAAIQSIQQMAGHDRVIVMGVQNAVHHTASSVDIPEQNRFPQTNYQRAISLNAQLASIYGSHYLDGRTQTNEASGGTDDAPNSSWLYDALHGNDRYYDFRAAMVAGAIMRGGY